MLSYHSIVRVSIDQGVSDQSNVRHCNRTVWRTILKAVITVNELEKQLLSLSSADRERLAVVMWDSLTTNPQVAANPNIDPDGLRLAEARDNELELGRQKTISHTEFVRRTGGTNRG